MSESIFKSGNVTVDISMLYDIAGNDEVFIRKMVYTFLDNIPSNVEKITSFHSQQDWESLYKAAHYTKSSLSIIKINDLYAVAQQIETNAKTCTNLDELSALIETLASQLSVAEQLLLENFPPVTGQPATGQ
jgi:HPt (histidine-containing phosphotransfer) domain-containing protein